MGRLTNPDPEPSSPRAAGRLADRVALITGTAGGQGRAAALLFAAEGATVVGCDLDGAGNDETRRLVEAAGGSMIAAGPVDLGDPDAAEAWVSSAVEAFGRIDILYNNAASVRFAPLLSGIDNWRFAVRNELDLVYYVCRAAWPHLTRPGASVINTSSNIALRGIRSMPAVAHAATKAAIIGLGRQLAIEGAPEGIRVNTIIPGLVRSPATEPVLALGADGPLGAVVDAIPLARPGECTEIAHLALFLASPESSYMTAAELVIDGGHSAAL